MASKIKSPEIKQNPIVDFSLGDRVYQIDPHHEKVYRRFVEIESAKAFQILSIWRTQHARV